MANNARFDLMNMSISRKKVEIENISNKVSDYFGCNVFGKNTIEKYVSYSIFQKYIDSIEKNEKMDREVAAQIAQGMKQWAIEKGVKSYTHWFQPLTGLTAEKHDSFFMPDNDGNAIEYFGASNLIQQEPDASSFPNGGIRQTFEARGYTAWDPTSPAFIIETESVKTLCIPTIFISYTGETLDYKAPLLKSIHALEKAVLPVVNYFDKSATKITATLGWEQEYFLIDEALFYARPDLVHTGRTLIGAIPAKGQQLEDHYFGAIPERMLDYMADLEKECHKLGIPVRTRHNEVAPSQFECAPMFEECNVAVDHNQLLMDVMERVAKKHKLRVLFHEKPFKGVNGSGKHNNWSMSTNTGKNLLSPGKTPKNNLLFLTSFINVIAAAANYADLIRASIASASNDHRLGANEAPPAIISVFIGDALTKVLKDIETTVSDEKQDEIVTEDIKLNIHNSIPEILLDNTDRNRTSPFAFTGNKFEIRAVGSSANCAANMIVINTIVANQFKKFKEDVENLVKNEGEKREAAIIRILKKYIVESKHILFEGDNYSKEWEIEAQKRGLNNVKTTPQALDFFLEKKNMDVFIENGVFSAREIEARQEILNHNYLLKVQIEGRLIGEMAVNYVIPAAVRYQNELLTNIKLQKEIGMSESSYQGTFELVESISNHINNLKSFVDQMIENRKKCNKIEHASDKAQAYCESVLPLFDDIRYHSDKLEQFVDNTLWTLPKYREILYIK
jgi:glutamine synthetase